MDFLLQTILSYLLVYKYLVLFLVTFFAALALPIPSAATLMASAAFAAQGYFDLSLVIITASLGNILGDNLCYWLARTFGPSVLRKLGFKKYLDSPVLLSFERHINRRPGIIILLSRVEVIATISVNLLAGLGKMPYRKYLLYDCIGEVLQVCMYASLGYLFGSQWQEANSIIGKVFLAMTFGGMIFAIFLWKKISKRVSRQKRS